MFSNAKTIIGLSLKHKENYVLGVFTLWIAIIYTIFPSIPPIQFLCDDWWKRILLVILPIIILLTYFFVYYLVFFKKIILTDEKYFFRPSGTADFIQSPQLILNENLASRFSFKLKLYGGEVSKFKNNKRFAIVIQKAPTIIINIKQRNTALNQDYGYSKNKEFFCLEQDYELFSSCLSFSLYIDTENALDTEGLKIYVEYGDVLKKVEKDPNFHPKNLIHKEEFYLSK